MSSKVKNRKYPKKEKDAIRISFAATICNREVHVFYKEPLYKEATFRRPKTLKSLVLLKTKSPRNFMAANNRVLGSPFHS